MGLLQLLFGSSVPRTESIEAVHLAAGRAFNFEIVGEAIYQEALDDLCGGKCDEGHNLAAIAQLCFQEDNPYDAKAVVVLINRRVVGQPLQLGAELQRVRHQSRRLSQLQ